MGIALVPGCLPASAADHYEVTAEDHEACDAVRFCPAKFPNEEKLVECMRVKRDQLSAICAAAIKAGLF